MTTSPLVWGALSLGVLSAAWPRRERPSRVWTAAWRLLCLSTFALAGLVRLEAETAALLGCDDFARAGLLPIGVWATAWGWSATQLERGLTGRDCSRSATTLGGLLLAITARDLVSLTMAMLLTSLGTTEPDAQRRRWIDTYAAVGLGVGVAGCLCGLGTLDLQELHQRLMIAYSPGEPHVPIGKPSLLLIGSLSVWLLAALTPFVSRMLSLKADEPWEIRLSGNVATGLVAWGAWARIGHAQLDALAPLMTTLALVLSALLGGIAIWSLADRSRLDRLLASLTAWVFAGQWLWLAVRTASSEAITVDGWQVVATSHDIAALAALAAVIRGWSARSTPHVYLDELRGLGAIRPLLATLLLVPLVSLLGGPLLAGGWLRLTLLLQLFSLHGPGPDDLRWPRFDVRDAALCWGIVWIVAGRTAVDVIRATLLETPLRSPGPVLRGWMLFVAVTTALALVAAGFWPTWLGLLATR